MPSKKHVTFELQTEQLIDGTTGLTTAQVCREYDELDYDPGLTEFIAYIKIL